MLSTKLLEPNDVGYNLRSCQTAPISKNPTKRTRKRLSLLGSTSAEAAPTPAEITTLDLDPVLLLRQA